jgi:hypothetical protein
LHERLQVTPESEASLLTVAVRPALPEVDRLCGAETLTDMVGLEMIVAVAWAEEGAFPLSVAFAVAVIVTVPPVGTVGGDLYLTASPLRLEEGAILPQLPNVLVHESFQSTPAFVLSPSTVATRLAVSPVSAEPSVNDAGETVTEIGGAGAIVISVLTLAVGSLIEAAVIVTVPDGTVAGAV